jgi:putative chitinase
MSAINKAVFYAEIRKTMFNKLSTSQVEGMEAILDEWVNGKYKDIRNLAYIFATVHHETDRTFQPIEEYGRGQGKDYGRKLKMGKGAGKRIAYTVPNQLYYGRGLVQLTWYENYEKAGKALKMDLLNYPELLLKLNVSVDVIFLGMFEGWFTGKKLSNYIGAKTDFVGARKIINGTDKASLIASYASNYLTALRAGVIA